MPFALRALLITDRRLAPLGDLPGLVRRTLEGAPRGQVAVQLREKDLSARELFGLARALREITLEAGAFLFINDRIDVALAVGAEGVHLAGHSLPPTEARRILGPGRLLGASAHSLGEARAARDGGCDFATFGPVFPTPSKAAYGPPVGLEALCEAAAALGPFPLIALGGVTPKVASACIESGASGLAAIRAVFTAPDPAEALRLLLRCASGESQEHSVPEYSVSERSVSAQSVPERSVPEHSVSERSVSAQSVPERSVQAPSVQARSVPAQSVPERGTPKKE